MLPAMISTMRKEVGSGVTIGIEDKGTIRNTFKEDMEIQEKLEFKFSNRGNRSKVHERTHGEGIRKLNR